MAITFREVRPSDEKFLKKLFRTTREREMEIAGLPEEERVKFVNFQFLARKQHYDEYFSSADNLIILSDGKPIGRHMLSRGKREYRLVLTEILPEYQKKGIGSRLVKDFLAEAAQADMPVRLQVQKYEAHLGFLLKLGFVKTGSSDYFIQLEWRASGDDEDAASKVQDSNITAD